MTFYEWRYVLRVIRSEITIIIENVNNYNIYLTRFNQENADFSLEFADDYQREIIDEYTWAYNTWILSLKLTCYAQKGKMLTYTYIYIYKS